MKKDIKQIVSTINKIDKISDTVEVFGSTNGRGIIPEKNCHDSGSYCINNMLTGNYKAGYPFGKIVEIYGPEGSGKSTLVLSAIARAQQKGYITALIDAEHALDPIYAERLGIDLNNLLVSQPTYGEDAFEIAYELCKMRVNLLGVDSVAALVPRSELEGNMGDAQMGVQPRMMGKGIRKLLSIASKSGTTILFINQIRMKLGVMFGNPETTPGGKALKFFSSIRIECRSPRSGKTKANKGELSKIGVDNTDKEIGTTMNLKTVKNRVFMPFRTCRVKIKYGEGIDQDWDKLFFLERVGIVSLNKTKSKVSYKSKTYDTSNFIRKLKDKKFRKPIIKAISNKLEKGN